MFLTGLDWCFRIFAWFLFVGILQAAFCTPTRAPKSLAAAPEGSASIQCSAAQFSLRGYFPKYYVHSNKINMEPKHGGLEDDFPFQLGDF